MRRGISGHRGAIGQAAATAESPDPDAALVVLRYRGYPRFMIVPTTAFQLGDLPLHPLIVHAAVVLIPLSALALLLLIFVRKWRKGYAWLAVLGIITGALAVGAAAASGKILASQLGEPARHAQFGLFLAIASTALAACSAIWFLLQRREHSQERDSSATRVFGWLAVFLIVATLLLTALTGHSGAVAVWGDRLPASDADSALLPTYTLDDVARHATVESCWAIVGPDVHDLTEWIGQHPGGSEAIVGLCGTDATAAFEAQHGNDSRPGQKLESTRIGVLGER